MGKFEIGDIVRVKDYNDIPADDRNVGLARLCGQIGEVVDKLYSKALDRYVYTIKFDNFDATSKKLWLSTQIEPWMGDEVTYLHEFEYLDNVVVAIFYEVKGDEKTEIGRGHGHIIHDGAMGIAQASSYALKKIYEKINGGNI